MWYYVVNLYKGSYSLEGKYKRRDSADRRTEKIQGGETSVFASYSEDPRVVVEEFKAEEVGRL